MTQTPLMKILEKEDGSQHLKVLLNLENEKLSSFLAAEHVDQIIQSIVALDQVLAIKTPVPPEFGSAMLSPLGAKGLEIARQSFDDLPRIVGALISEGRPSERDEAHLWTGLVAKAKHASAILSSFGLSSAESEAVMTQAFVSTALDFMSGLSLSKRMHSLSVLNHLGGEWVGEGLGNNSIALELAVGTLGAERFQLSCMKTGSSLEHGMLYRYSERGEPDLGLLDESPKGMPSALAELNNRWIHSGSSMDDISSRKVDALLSLDKAISMALSAASPNWRPHSKSKDHIAMAVEQALIAAACDRRPHSAQSLPEASDLLEGKLGAKLASKRPDTGSSTLSAASSAPRI